MLFADSPEVIIREIQSGDLSGIIAVFLFGVVTAALMSLYDHLVKVPREARLKLAAERTEQEKQRTEQAKILAEVEKQQRQRESTKAAKGSPKAEADECALGGDA